MLGAYVYRVRFKSKQKGEGVRWYVGQCKAERWQKRKNEHHEGKGEGAKWTETAQKDTKRQPWGWRWTLIQRGTAEELRRAVGRAELRQFCTEAQDTERGPVREGPTQGRGACFSEWFTPLGPVFVGLMAFWPAAEADQDDLMTAAAVKWPHPVGLQVRGEKLGGRWPKLSAAQWAAKREEAWEWAARQSQKRRDAAAAKAAHAKAEAEAEAEEADRQQARAARAAAKKRKAAKEEAEKKASHAKKKTKEKAAKKKEAEKKAKEAAKEAAKQKAARKKQQAAKRATDDKGRDRSDRSQTDPSQTNRARSAAWHAENARKAAARRAAERDRVAAVKQKHATYDDTRAPRVQKTVAKK